MPEIYIRLEQEECFRFNFSELFPEKLPLRLDLQQHPKGVDKSAGVVKLKEKSKKEQRKVKQVRMRKITPATRFATATEGGRKKISIKVHK